MADDNIKKEPESAAIYGRNLEEGSRSSVKDDEIRQLFIDKEKITNKLKKLLDEIPIDEEYIKKIYKQAEEEMLEAETMNELGTLLYLNLVKYKKKEIIKFFKSSADKQCHFGCSNYAEHILEHNPAEALKYSEKAVELSKGVEGDGKHQHKYVFYKALNRNGQPQKAEEAILEYLEYILGSSGNFEKLDEDEVDALVYDISELQKKENCKERLKKIRENTNNSSAVNLFMIKLYRNLGENTEAWSLYCSFHQNSHLYKYAIKEAKQLIIGSIQCPMTQQDPIPQGPSLSCRKEFDSSHSIDGTSINDINIRKDRLKTHAIRRHKAESKFFDPKRSKKRAEIVNLLKEIINHRYRSEDSQDPNQGIDLEGKSARLVITAERLFQEIVIGLSKKDEPKLGIPVHRKSFYNVSYGPIEKYKIGEIEIEFEHRTESGSSVGISPIRERLGNGYVKDVENYDNICYFVQKLTDKEIEKEKKLAALMIEFAKSHKPITLHELREIYEDAKEEDANKLNKYCFLIIQREQAQWHSAMYLNCEEWHLGLSVAQARCLILMREGFLSFEDTIKNITKFGVYTCQEMRKNNEEVETRCQNVEKLYTAYFQCKHMEDYMKLCKQCIINGTDCTISLKAEQAHNDLREIYGGDSDTSEEYSFD